MATAGVVLLGDSTVEVVLLPQAKSKHVRTKTKPSRVRKNVRECVIPSPFAPPLRTVPSRCSGQALSAAKELRVNFARNLALKLKERRDSSSPTAPRNDGFGRVFSQPARPHTRAVVLITGLLLSIRM